MKKTENNMIRRIIAAAAVALAMLPVHAAIAGDSIRAKIREIKLSEQYVYADAGSPAGHEEARQIAVGKLEAAAVELMTRHNMTKEEIKAMLKQLPGKAQQFTYRNGSFFKVFACVAKGELVEALKAESPAVEPAVAEVPVTEVPAETAQTVVPPTAPTAGEAVETVPDSTKALMAQQMNLRPVTVQSAKVENTRTQFLQMDRSTFENALKHLPATGDVLKPVMTPRAERVVNSLLGMETYESAMLYLASMKEDGRLMYGSMRKAVRPERLYLMVVKDGKVVTVLYKGGRERINLRTLLPENMERYLGYGIVWFQVFE